MTHNDMSHKERHIFADELRSHLDRDIWDSYFKFSFVRNPWDRLVSWYCMCIQEPNNPFMQSVNDNAKTFKVFIKEHHRFTDGEKLIANQADYICDESGCLLDFVGRFENLHGDLATAMHRMQQASTDSGSSQPFFDRITLKHHNDSVHGPYCDYYDTETRDIVASRFARDIELFGYEF